MKHLLAILTTVLLGIPVLGQGTDAVSLLTHFAGKRVTFDYSLQTDAKMPVAQEGSAVIDGNCFCIKGKGLEIWCDGTTRWTVDTEAKEVYIEDDGGLETMYSRLLEMAEGISGLKVSGDSLCGVWTEKEGADPIAFSITSIRTAEAGDDTSEFVFGASRLGKDWVVTDLR